MAAMSSRRALLIACGDYRAGGLPRLASAASDVRRLKSVLERPGLGDFTVQQVLDADLVSVQKALHLIFHEASSDDILLVYLSGHGMKDSSGRFYLALPETELGAMPATALSGRFLRDQMNDTACARVVIILDSCYAGAFGRDLAAKSVVASPGIPGELEEPGRGHVVLAATSSVDLAFETVAEEPYSTFTRAICDGLETGEADLDDDGWIGLQDLWDYLVGRFSTSSLSQRPELTSLGVSSDLQLCRTPSEARGRRFDTGLSWALESVHPELRLAATEVLARYGQSQNPARRDSARQALQVLVDDYDSEVRSAAAEAVFRMEVEGVAPLTTVEHVARAAGLVAWVQIPAASLRRMAASVARFVGQDELLPLFRPVLFWFDKSVFHAVATDRYRLDHWSVSPDLAGGDGFSVGVSARQFAGLAQLPLDGAVRIEVYDDEVELVAKSAATIIPRVTDSLSPGNVLRYLAPDESTDLVTLEAAQMLDAVESTAPRSIRHAKNGRRSRGLASPPTIDLSIEGPFERVTVAMRGHSPTSVEAHGSLVAGPLRVNSAFLAEGLGSFLPGQASLAVAGQLLVLQAQDSSGALHRHWIMSMRSDAP